MFIAESRVISSLCEFSVYCWEPGHLCKDWGLTTTVRICICHCYSSFYEFKLSGRNGLDPRCTSMEGEEDIALESLVLVIFWGPVVLVGFLIPSCDKWVVIASGIARRFIIAIEIGWTARHLIIAIEIGLIAILLVLWPRFQFNCFIECFPAIAGN